MIIVTESASALKRFVANTGLKTFAKAMAMRRVLAFILHRGRMSCSQATQQRSTEIQERTPKQNTSDVDVADAVLTSYS